MANKHNLVPFINYGSDLWKIGVSHLCNLITKEFTLILHIPVVSKTYLLDLYNFLPLPIYFNVSANVSITPDVGQSNLLAIGHSKSF
jgi:hypothetical protein